MPSVGSSNSCQGSRAGCPWLAAAGVVAAEAASSLPVQRCCHHLKLCRRAGCSSGCSTCWNDHGHTMHSQQGWGCYLTSVPGQPQVFHPPAALGGLPDTLPACSWCLGACGGLCCSRAVHLLLRAISHIWLGLYVHL
jgi:hypothetical protein